MAQDKSKKTESGRSPLVPEQSIRTSGEAQNVRDEDTERITDDHARNKAMEGMRQKRDDGSGGQNAERDNMKKGR
ncbi:MAG: hypothetical protein JWP27_1607 [Flaviaesturariibacter sp.]|nr:hypothetical protein [Flaviaesturariibacter sp.]